MLLNIVITGNFIILCFFILLTICYIGLLFLSLANIKLSYDYSRHTNIFKLIKYHFLSKIADIKLPPITISIPIYNKNPVFLQSIKSVLRSDYKNIEIFVVNDASTDDAKEMLIQEFEFEQMPKIIFQNKLKTSEVESVYISKTHKNLYLINKKHGGVGDSHNVSINMSKSPYFITFDSDSIMDEQAISNFMVTILRESHNIIVGGCVYILNGCEINNGELIKVNLPSTYIGNLQVNEYERSHVFSRTGWGVIGGALTYSGTATLFEKQMLIDMGGFDRNNFAQDAEIVIKAEQYTASHEYPCKTLFNPAIETWTTVPANLKAFIRQRNHWQRGLLKSMAPYFFSIFKRFKINIIIRYFLFLFLEVLSPIGEVCAYIFCIISLILGIVTFTQVGIFIFIAWLFLMTITLSNYFINKLTFNIYDEGDTIFKRIFYTTMEMIGFRQITV